VYAAGLLSDIDQLPPVALNTPEAMSCFWRTFSPKGHYHWAPVLLFQHQYKYSNELCLRMCQNAKRREDLMEFEPKPRRAVQVMNDVKAETRKSKRENKEMERLRKEKHDKKLISRKLDHEVRQVAEWNKQRLMFAARIDGEFKKGKHSVKRFCCIFSICHQYASLWSRGLPHTSCVVPLIADNCFTISFSTCKINLSGGDHITHCTDTSHYPCDLSGPEIPYPDCCLLLQMTC